MSVHHHAPLGLLLFLAAVLLNPAGYCLGYWLIRFLGLDAQSTRAMALEVGRQNGGMASGISGSILANYWSKHPPRTKSQKRT